MSIEFHIDQREKVKVTTYRNLNLLAHAQLEELNIGSRCGGHGICGGDRIQILKGSHLLSSFTEVEKNHLTKEELSSGWRIACQCWPNSDLADIQVRVP